MNKDAIYSTMVIRSQAETIELQEKEIERLTNDYKILKELQMKTNEENEKLLKKSYSDDVRITKAIEYNKKNIHSQTLDNILQGEDNETR